MKAKIQIGIGLFVAIVVGIGILLVGYAFGGEFGYDGILLGDLILLALLATYTIAITMKKRTLSKIIVLLWCVSWVVPFIVDIVIRSTPDICSHLFARLLVWPYFVSQQFFFGYPYFAKGIHAVAFGGACTLLIAALLWIGINGLSQLVKAENQPNNKPLSE